jgi:hypothetical protein
MVRGMDLRRIAMKSPNHPLRRPVHDLHPKTHSPARKQPFPVIDIGCSATQRVLGGSTGRASHPHLVRVCKRSRHGEISRRPSLTTQSLYGLGGDLGNAQGTVRSRRSSWPCPIQVSRRRVPKYVWRKSVISWSDILYATSCSREKN